MLGRVLIIAGSDSGGGAGIQADIKAVTCLGGYAATAVTALTAQNTHGVSGIHEVPPAFVRAQMEAVLSDIGADCVKTGMLASAAIVEAVAEGLAALAPDVPLVLDPVMVAKGGAALLEGSAAGALISLLVPRARLLTPNIPEAEVLLGRAITGVADMERAALDLLALGPKAVLLKGGHLEGDELVDVLADGGGVRRYAGRRIHTRSTHGTGCTLASSIAAGLARGMDLSDAVECARAYLVKAIETAPGLGSGHGPLNHGHPLAARLPGCG
ncbi:Bifunctional hydroxy-methylpyrimidine kinase and hydroxy-phosphomethylpyrimidine kinase [Magnetospirillum sp. XM-1]|uniref:bifunctional hydroxymethylpyrimidine kinase/phosphomethylpyrimidine kinase n=1 Tax=Magnetospirillum sp. XM-1 TaxID=1663591 RepID=UPI00073DDA9D|nr:bifunctional hydroxymethylpyrimidine kinase/phosphomethylpyrimidine kinase [Magnetospirillum sp. XM-1]CUW41170.1 Bifunctional hydroxy-methylpyrimidine kinase and hydroxy-phosphomethylpyrimidine kinase [Magnetospirillum sp. XM-1]